MNSSEKTLSAKAFSHIYYEKEALDYPIAKKIISKFKNASLIEISHYKDIFNRSRQEFALQKNSQSIILAVKHGELIYPGAKVCQSFGNDHFYYTSNIMNCIYNCDYCYLQGMYPSGNMVIFVNVDDIFSEVERLLSFHSVYLCISYDTDLLALEDLTGLVSQWTSFASQHPDLKIEIRTKSAYKKGFNTFAKGNNIIFAWTLSPSIVCKKYEHKTPPLEARLEALTYAQKNGYTTRLCFDPILDIPNYKAVYSQMFYDVFNKINPESILDCSYGIFRISADYLKSMKRSKLSLATAYPYSNINGVCSYDEKKSREIINFARLELLKYLPEDKLFTV